MNKPRMRWHPLFKQYVCHDRQPGDKITGKIAIGAGYTPERAYDNFVECLCTRRYIANRFAPSDEELRDLETKRRDSLCVFKRIQRAFSHRANGTPRSWK